MHPSPEHKIYLKNRALEEIHASEILEWYRHQYNIPLHDFYHMNIDEDIAHIDFYRRQYWNELRYGVREWEDVNTDFKIPPYTLYRPNGGALPVPNGFGFDGTYSIKAEHYMDTNTTSSSETKTKTASTNEAEGYTYTENSNMPQRLRQPASGMLFEDETSAYRSNKDDFDALARRANEGDDSVWEELERIVVG